MLFGGEFKYRRRGTRAEHDIIRVSASRGLAIIVEEPMISLRLAFALLAIAAAQILKEHKLAAAAMVGALITGNGLAGSVRQDG